MKNAPILFALLALLTFAFPAEAEAQCAMCRASLEVNASAGDSIISSPLNRAILFLLAMPYILVSLGAYLWFRNSKKHREERQRIESRLGTKMS